MYKKVTKWVASGLVFILMFTYLSTIKEVLATSVEEQNNKTNQANVEFDTYLLENEQKTDFSIKKIGKENYLYTYIKVKETGYLKEAVVEIADANFEMTKPNEEKVSKVEDNKIYFNQIKNGETVEVAIPIQLLQSEEISLSEFNKQNKVKFTAIYVDENGNEKKVAKNTTVQLAWTAEKQSELNTNIIKFIPYEVNGEKVLILQMLVESYLKDNKLPVKENKIEISIPNIKGTKPEEVKVVANSTKATNGDDEAINFNSSNYVYNKETDKLTINVLNQENEQGKVSWNKEAKDQFIVTCVYKQDITTLVPVSIETNNQLTIYESSLTKATRNISSITNMQEKIGELVDFELQTTEELSKGQIYANYESTTKKETQYNEKIITNVGLTKIGETDLMNKIVLELGSDNFTTSENTKISTQANTYYKQLKIEKTEFNKILGEEGFIKLYYNDTLINTIDKNLNEDKQGNLVVNLEELNVNSLKIETSKPVTEGKFTLELEKAIKSELNYSKEQVKNITNIETNIIGKVFNQEKKLMENTLTKTTNFIEPTSQAEIIIDNSNLSTVVTNQNVKISAILKTDTLYCNLYKNPTIKITLPSYVETINIKNVNVLFDTQGSKLTLKNYKVITNSNNTKTIEIELAGTQTEYTLGAVAKGVNVVITSDITANKLTPNKQETINMVYTNESTNEQKETSTVLNFVAPTGVVTTSTISNYVENAENLTSISGEEKTALIETQAGLRNATFTMNVINNYNNTIDNISILGRTPFKSNKAVISKTDLGSTMNMPLTSAISVNSADANKVAIYYSENGEATKDLSNTANGWTLTPTNLANVKSYLIVLTDYTMNTGDSISFTYNAQIPANMQHNESAYENYAVYFNNNLEMGAIQDSQASTKIGVTTGQGPVLESSISSSTTEEILTGKFIKYTVKVKNAGKQVAEDVKVTVDLPKCLNIINFFEGESGQYTRDYTSTQYSSEIGKMNPNEEITKEFWVIVNKLTVEDICKDESHYQTFNGVKYHKKDITHSNEEYKTNITLKANITAKDLSKSIQSNEVQNIVKKAYFNTSVGTTTNGLETLNEGDKFIYNIAVKSYDSQIVTKNTVVKVVMPNELEYEKTEIKKFNIDTNKYEIITDEINYNQSTRELTINLGDVSYEDNRQIQITSKVKALGQNEYIKQITSVAKISADGINEETSNSIIDTISKEGINVSQTATIPDGNVISAGEKFSYRITIENISGNVISNLKITDYLPKELIYVNTTYTIDEQTKTISNIDSENKTEASINIPKGKTAVVNINVVAKEVTENTKIENKATITTNTLNIETNKISHTIEAVDYEKPDDITTILRKINGQVWKDENNNGIKDENETKVSDVQVLLFNNQTGNLVTDSNGNVLKIITDSEGNYSFKDIAKGKYTVIFLYDTANYSATSYQKNGVDESKNSDVVDSKITLDGITRTAGITEEININDSNIYNIDLGLVLNPKFDLKLDKVVSSITLQEGNNTDVYNYNDAKIAKKDLIGKDANNTSIVVEYKIKVTNEGAVSGYVKKIVDYIPSELKFNSELNTDWYVAENGAIYNSSLANTLINPGETKQVTLLLTKKMTDNNLGLYNNTAEIYEAYNDLGIQDVDSTPANKVSSEDDISSADVLITVKTGQTIIFFGLTVSIISTITIGAYFIKKKVLR